MLKSIQLMLTFLSIMGLSATQLLFISLVTQNNKAFANSQNTIYTSTEQQPVISNKLVFSCPQLYSTTVSKSFKEAKLALKFSPQQKPTLTSINFNNYSSQKIAQAGPLIYLGKVGDATIYRESGTGLIVVFLSGLQFIYNSISSAINFISSSIQSSASRKRCEYQGEYLNNPNSSEKTCAYKCRGYGALATFPWSRNQPCPPSFDGNFPGP